MIKFEFDTDIPDVNYYTPSEIEPVVEGTKIIFYNGKGRSRHWGRPEITTEVIYKDKNFLSAVILYRTKYSAGRFYRHYLLYNRKILKIEWKQVPMRYQSKVLEACEDKYIVPPGKIDAYAGWGGELADARQLSRALRNLGFVLKRGKDGTVVLGVELQQ